MKCKKLRCENDKSGILLFCYGFRYLIHWKGRFTIKNVSMNTGVLSIWDNTFWPFYAIVIQAQFVPILCLGLML